MSDDEKLVQASPEEVELAKALMKKVKALLVGQEQNVITMALLNIAIENELLTGTTRRMWIEWCTMFFDFQKAPRDRAAKMKGPPS